MCQLIVQVGSFVKCDLAVLSPPKLAAAAVCTAVQLMPNTHAATKRHAVSNKGEGGQRQTQVWRMAYVLFVYVQFARVLASSGFAEAELSAPTEAMLNYKDHVRLCRHRCR